MFDLKQSDTFPGREEETLKFWQENDIFKKSVALRENSPLFSTYDGPPFATGLPHYGHIVAGTIKDSVLRFRGMQGFNVPRRFGWDCHGLPVESEIEKGQQLSGAPDIEQFGIANFNEECRSIVLRYAEQWKSTVNRMGRWVDFDKTYHTMDRSFMESVWWVFGQLFAKGLVYEGFKVMPYSAKLGTPLSNFEANLNYRDVDDPSLFVLFPIDGEENSYFMAWTTTPWTLPSNLGLGVGPEIGYVKLREKESGRTIIMGENRVSSLFTEADSYEIIEKMSGKELGGMRYQPLFSYFEGEQENAFQVLVDEFVTDGDGTGVVHLAPAFGEQDYFLCKREGIEPVCPVSQNGHFTDEIPEFEGKFVKDADKEIVRQLKEKGLIFKQTQIRHRYPFCWRSDTPLIYKTVGTWFVNVEKIKKELLASNEEISWVPGHIKHGRFGKWLENARDWAVSRNRYWGTPIPVWRSESGELRVINSIAELEKRTGKKIDDIHRHFIDDLTFEENGQTFRRIPEVFDCWFESGSMPYAQNHYPFANKDETEKGFPAQFIGEGLDQTRGWFYTLNVLSTALFGTCAAKNVIVNGIILAEDGNKMSKRLKNYTEPEVIFNEHGADAVRLYLLRSPAVIGDDMRFSDEGVKQIVRGQLIPLWNACHFLSTYARIYSWKPAEKMEKPAADIDRWMLSKLQKVIKDVTEAMDNYELNKAVDPFVAFIDEITNWYIRRSRRRFWSEEKSRDRDQAFQTLYHVLKEFVKITAPFIPFISDSIYRQLRSDHDPESVHLCDMPKYDPSWRDEELESEMGYVQECVSFGHALRKEHKLKVRQPLASVLLITSDPDKMVFLERGQHLIAEELNVKSVQMQTNEEEFVQLKAKPNFRTLGAKLGKLMRGVQQEVTAFSRGQICLIEEGNSISIEVDGEGVDLTPEDIIVERSVKEGLVAATTESGITLALEKELTQELVDEGIAREVVNKLNTMRRDAKLDVQDRIHVQIDCAKEVKRGVEIFKNYVCEESLTTDLRFVKPSGEHVAEWDINGFKAAIGITKA